MNTTPLFSRTTPTMLCNWLYTCFLPPAWQSGEAVPNVPTFTPENSTVRIAAIGPEGLDQGVIVVLHKDTLEPMAVIRVEDVLAKAQGFFEANLFHLGIKPGEKAWKRLLKRARKGLGYAIP